MEGPLTRLGRGTLLPLEGVIGTVRLGILLGFTVFKNEVTLGIAGFMEVLFWGYLTVISRSPEMGSDLGTNGNNILRPVTVGRKPFCGCMTKRIQ